MTETKPIGKLDHIGIAVRSIADARRFFEQLLGARFLYDGENEEEGFRFCELDLSGFTLELLEPTRPDSFLAKFLERNGEGFHHLTLDVADPRAHAERLKSCGVRVVGEKQFSPTSYEAFISPRSAHGLLIQLGSGYPTLARAPEWFEHAPKRRE